MMNQALAITPAESRRIAAEARSVSQGIGRTVTPAELLRAALSGQSLANAGDEISERAIARTAKGH